MTSSRKYRVSSETTPVSGILWEGTFEVPWHQREFDWDPEHVGQFWDDIQRSVETGQSDYFVGGITLTHGGERLFHIQDGQQRLTTYSMMFAVLRDKLPESYNADAQRIIYDIPHNVSPAQTKGARLRIVHQEIDKDKYSVMAEGGVISPNGKLSRAQEVLRGKAESLNEAQATTLFDYLLNSVIANKTINETDNATQVFETLNDRGKRLNPVDLLRNFIYSCIEEEGAGLRDDVHRNLENMRREARDNKSDGHLVAYVRCALQCRYGHLREKTFYEDARNKVREEIEANGTENTASTIRDISRYLSNRNNIIAFKAVYAGDEHGSEIAQFTQAAGTANRRRKMSDYVREFREYKVSLPVTFAVLARFLNAPSDEQKDIARAGHQVVQSLNALIMRTASVRPSFAPSTVEGPIAQWGRNILEGIDRDTPKKFAEAMKQLDPESVWDDKNFQERMRDQRIPQNSKARRLLYPLYRYVQSDLTDAKNLTLEHVLPESDQFISGWEPHFNADNHEQFWAMLGNMTLLTPADNKSSSGFNTSFATKKAVFDNSTIQNNKELAKEPDWTPQVIRKRQSDLSKLACEVWKPHT